MEIFRPGICFLHFTLYVHMKNFKKLFASLAVVAMLASTVPTAVLGATSYSSELQGAYDYAYGIGVTTQSSIDNANMFGSLIRSNMAKMMVNYAKEVKGLKADTTLACNFTDVANQTEEMQGYIKEACQMGLMGQGITAFNPNGIVTRAQFGTVLDRVLNGTANDGGNPYYADHLSALKDAGVMTNISTPNAPEVRGYVMLMMQRAANGGTTPATCDTPENQLSCSLGLSTCPAECTSTVVKDGTLNVTLDSSTPDAANIPGGIPAFQTAVYKFTADKDVRLDSLVLDRGGFSAASIVTKAALYIDGARISKDTSFNSTTKEVTLNITNGYELKAGETVKIAVVVPVASYVGNVGDTFFVTLKDVASTAQDVNLASNLTSSTFTIAAGDVATATLSQYSSVAAPKVGQNGAELFKFQIDNSLNGSAIDENLTLNSMTFKELGTIDEQTDLANFKLFADGVQIGSTVAKMTSKYLTFNNLGYVVLKDKDPKFSVQADIVGSSQTSPTVQFEIEKKMDIIAKDTTYGYGANIKLSGADVEPYAFTSQTVSAGQITLARTNAPSTDLIGNRKAVVLGQMQITNSSGKPLNLASFALDLAATSGGVATLPSKIFETDSVRIQVNGGTSYYLDALATTGRYGDTSIDVTLPAGTTTFTVLADTINKDLSPYKVDMSWDATHSFTIQDANDNPVTDITPSSLSWRESVGTNSSATATNTILAPKSFVKGSTDVEVARFKIKAGSASLVNLKELNFVSAPAGLTNTTISSAVLSWSGAVNGSKSVSISAGTLDFNSMNISIPASTEEQFSLSVGVAKNTTATGFTFNLDPTNFTAEDKDGNTITAITNADSVDGRLITVSSVGSVSLAVDTSVIKYTHNIVAGDTADVAQYNVNTQYEDSRAEGAVVTFDNSIANSVSAVQLWYNGVKVGETTNISSHTATFDKTDLNNGIMFTVGQSPLKVVLVTKSIGNNDDHGAADQTDSVATVALTNVYGSDSGNPITVATNSDATTLFSIVPADLVVSKLADGSFKLNVVKGNNTDYSGNALKVKITSVKLTKNSASGVTGYVLTLPDSTPISAATPYTTPTFTVSNYELADGDTFTLAATVDSSAYNYSRNLSLPKDVVTYTVNYNDGVKTYTTTMPAAITILQH